MTNLERLIEQIKRNFSDKRVSKSVPQLTYAEGMMLINEIERLQSLLDEVDLEFTDVHEEDQS